MNTIIITQILGKVNREIHKLNCYRILNAECRMQSAELRKIFSYVREVVDFREWCRMAFASVHKAYVGTSCAEKMTNWCKNGCPSMGHPFFDDLILQGNQVVHIIYVHTVASLLKLAPMVLCRYRKSTLFCWLMFLSQTWWQPTKPNQREAQSRHWAQTRQSGSTQRIPRQPLRSKEAGWIRD